MSKKLDKIKRKMVKLESKNHVLRTRIFNMQKRINDYQHALQRGSMLLQHTGKMKMKPENKQDCLAIQHKYDNCLACLFYNKTDCLGFKHD